MKTHTYYEIFAEGNHGARTTPSTAATLADARGNGDRIGNLYKSLSVTIDKITANSETNEELSRETITHLDRKTR